MDNLCVKLKITYILSSLYDLQMKILLSHKVTSLLRSLVYLGAFLACVFSVFSVAGKVDSEQLEKKFTFRIMTYNIHHGEGLDEIVDLNRIAEVIKKENPDILLLQEVDVNLSRSGNIDIPQLLSKNTELKHVVFGKNLDIEKGGYGNATLSRFPITSSKNYQFEQIGPEQRGVMATEITFNGQNLLVMNSHFDHSRDDSERILYAGKIITDILPEYKPDAVLFGGDFNDIPTSQMYRQLRKEFDDAWSIFSQGEGFTIPANQPTKRIDYILFSGSIQPDSIWVPKTEASDHLPVVADFIWVDN